MENLFKKFGYSKDWLRFNILTSEYFELQVKDHNESGHQGWEHYRYGALMKWLKEKSQFTDIQISNVIDIATKEPDQAMAKSFIKELVSSGKAKENQVKTLNAFLRNI